MTETSLEPFELYLDNALEGIMKRAAEASKTEVEEYDIDFTDYYETTVSSRTDLDTPTTYRVSLPYRSLKINDEIETIDERFELDVYREDDTYKIVPKQTKSLKSLILDDKTLFKAFEEEIESSPKINIKR